MNYWNIHIPNLEDLLEILFLPISLEPILNVYLGQFITKKQIDFTVEKDCLCYFHSSTCYATQSVEYNFTLKNEFDSYPLEIIAKNYSPFGMQQPGRAYSSNSYRYGFQGQEKDDEVKGSGNSINYKYRMHDARIGRFFAVDPLAPKYPHNSPYAFSENRVIDSGELEGLERYFAADGSFVGKYGESCEIRIIGSIDNARRLKETFARVTKADQVDGTFFDSALKNSSAKAYEMYEEKQYLKEFSKENKDKPEAKDSEFGRVLFKRTLTDQDGEKLDVFVPGMLVQGPKKTIGMATLNHKESTLRIGKTNIVSRDYRFTSTYIMKFMEGWSEMTYLHTHPPHGYNSKGNSSLSPSDYQIATDNKENIYAIGFGTKEGRYFDFSDFMTKSGRGETEKKSATESIIINK